MHAKLAARKVTNLVQKIHTILQRADAFVAPADEKVYLAGTRSTTGRKMFGLLEELKKSILAQLVAAGGSSVVTNPAMSDVCYRAVAELVAADCVYDAEDDHGQVLLVITRKGIEEVKT